MLKNYKLSPVLDENLQGNRVRLPANILGEISTELDSLPSPLFFRLGDRVHGTAWEFIADPGTIGISSSLFELLQPLPSQLSISLAQLEKCTFTKLIPTSLSYLSIRDMKRLLEAHLRRNYSVLNKGQNLKIEVQGKLVEFMVEDLKPGDSCSCIDTDIEVDITPRDDEMAVAALSHSKNSQLEWKPADNSSIIVLPNESVTNTLYYKVVYFNLDSSG
jgi:hypothetical protein